MSSVFLQAGIIYLLAGVVITLLCQASLIEQATRMQAEMSLEAGAEVPYRLVLAFYNALAVLGWPFFLVVTIKRKS